MPSGGSFVSRARFLLLIMVFCCFFVLSSQRINMSFAILDMVNWTEITLNSSKYCPRKYDKDVRHGLVLASYFYGLILMQLPAEFLAEKFSAQYLALIGMGMATICCFVTPTAAWHIGSLIYAQIMKAIGHALTIPAFSVMLGRWIPPSHLVRNMAYATCGIPTGAFFTILVGGVVCDSPNYRWPYLFYIPGIMGSIWCVMWLYLCCDLRFMPILSSQSFHVLDFPKRHSPLPLIKILKSEPFWSYVCAGIASYWMIAFNILILPSYFRTVFELDNQWNGLVSSFPSVLQAFVYLLSFTMSDRIIGKRIIGKTTVRRITICAGLATFATSMVLLTFSRCNQAMGVLLMVIGIGASGFNLASMSILAVDMSPTYSGIVSGIMKTIGAVAGSALPLMIGYLTEAKGGIDDWGKVFYASAFVTFICMIIFMAYNSSDIQPWDSPQDSKMRLFEMLSKDLDPSNKQSTSTTLDALTGQSYKNKESIQEESIQEESIQEVTPERKTSDVKPKDRLRPSIVISQSDYKIK